MSGHILPYDSNIAMTATIPSIATAFASSVVRSRIELIYIVRGSCIDRTIRINAIEAIKNIMNYTAIAGSLM